VVFVIRVKLVDGGPEVFGMIHLEEVAVFVDDYVLLDIEGEFS
jgi:hypothetical protein